MLDVLIVGGGPAGAIAGLVAARAGARVRIVDRAVFPRDKLCGDTINPGALAVLRRLGIDDAICARGLSVRGMIVTGEHGARVAGEYPAGMAGRAILRREFDALLLQAALDAGCEFDHGVTVRRPIVDTSGNRPIVSGVATAGRAAPILRARVVIGADGRRSRLAFGLGLAHHPRAPRRWAIGGYFEGLDRGRGAVVMGEMHVRRDGYVGVAPVPGGLTNVCVVRPWTAADPFDHPLAAFRRTLDADAALRERVAGGRLVDRPVVLGPLAVDSTGGAFDGLLLAGDAAGFVDPMTGDGLRFAIQGGELAALAALQALERGWSGVHRAHAAARAQAFAPKWRFNRTLRTLVASPRSVAAAAFGARLAPAAIRAVIARAGDCDLAA